MIIAAVNTARRPKRSVRPPRATVPMNIPAKNEPRKLAKPLTSNKPSVVA
jgi:hypothetical protein